MKLREIKNYTQFKEEKLKKEDWSFFDKDLPIYEKHALYVRDVENRLAIENIEKQEAFQKKHGKTIKLLKRSFATILATTFAAAVGVGATRVINNTSVRNTENYKSNEQLLIDAKDFGANLSSARIVINSETGSTYYRLKHNNGAPIRVYIDEDLRETYKGHIENSLKYVENLFKNINDKYHFKIIENEAEYNLFRALNFTTLRYSSGNLTKGSIVAHNQAIPQLFNDDFFSKNTILLHDQLLKQYPDNHYDVALHELLHSFGLGDVMNVKNSIHWSTLTPNFLDTYMHYEGNSNYFNGIHPNDYKVLHSLYNMNHLEKGKVNVFEKNKILENINEFEEEFYNYNYSKRIPLSNQTPLDIEEVKNNKYTYYTWSWNAKEQKRDYVISELTFDDELYKLTTYDEFGNVLDHNEGIYRKYGNFIRLGEVTFKNSFKERYENYRPKQMTGTLMFALTSNSLARIYSPSGIFTINSLVSDKDKAIESIYDFPHFNKNKETAPEENNVETQTEQQQQQQQQQHFEPTLSR